MSCTICLLYHFNLEKTVAGFMSSTLQIYLLPYYVFGVHVLASASASPIELYNQACWLCVFVGMAKTELNIAKYFLTILTPC